MTAIARRAGRRTLRCAVVVAAVVAPMLIWLVADPLLGHELSLTDESTHRTLEIDLVPAAVVALLAALDG